MQHGHVHAARVTWQQPSNKSISSANERLLEKGCRYLTSPQAMAPVSLQVRFSELPEMQSLGDSSQTLGFIFASVGVGCLGGPVLMNKFTPPRCESQQRKEGLLR